MTKYMQMAEHAAAARTFGRGYWPTIRFGDNIETAYWLYNRTGDAWLLELAKKIHDNMQDWTTGVHNWHNVNLAQGFREPGVYYAAGAGGEIPPRRRAQLPDKSWASTASSPAADLPGTKIVGPASPIRARASRPAASSSSCTASKC